MYEVALRRMSTGWLILWACFLTCTLTVAGRLSADDREEAEAWALQQEEVEDTSQPIPLAGPISSGFVLVDGQFVSAPYTVELIEGKVHINGHFTAMPQLGWNGPPPPPPGAMRWRGAGMYPARKVRWRRASPQHFEFARRLERDLSDDALIVIFDGEYPFFFASSTAASIFTALSEPESTGVKVGKILTDPACAQVSADRWSQIAATFKPNADFDRRAVAMIEREREFQVESEAATKNARWYTLLASQPAQYGITLAAMLLGVVALGNLLLYRPHGPARWRDVHDEPGVGLDIRRIVVILALLGVFDLVLTLAAQQAGGFLELNPLGSQLIQSPALLAGFKLTSLLLACWILFRLRRYHGAQVASWWMCLICTILTFRWVTFNSLFFS